MPTDSTASTIFIVDDDQGLLRLIDKALKREGFSTATAISGQDAIAWLAKNRADLMLLDLKLQDIEGKELINHLAEIGRRMPFIIITGQGDERVAVEMMKRGALDYLVKDGDFLQFVPAVAQRALAQIAREKKLAVAEEALGRSEANLAEAQQGLLEISEREQRRIGQDLHDGLGQCLAGIELMSQVLEQNLATKKLKAEATRAGDIAKHVRDAISQARFLARGLSPVVLESEGLMSSLKELSDSTEKIFRVPCEFHCDKPVLIEDNAVATHLYRIAQEAVSNAIKHGRAKRVQIHLKSNNDRLLLLVKDDGVGLPKVLPENRGMGLRIMQYRAGMIGGTLIVQREPSGGTSVTCSFRPCDKKEPEKVL
jgi:signal transduction histidine kinase